jgi:hypothetical protein
MDNSVNDKTHTRKRPQPSPDALQPTDVSDAETATAFDRPVATPTGFRLALDALTIEAEHPRSQRDAVRATVSVSRAGELLYRDQVNLTSARSRVAFLRKLIAQSVDLSEAALIALEVACRTRPKPALAEPCSAEASAPCEPLDLAGLAAVVGKWLLIEDDAFLAVLVGAVLAHRLEGAAVWLLIVAPPSSAKSELLSALFDCSGIYALSKLNARTFASGLKAEDVDSSFSGQDPSLLARLKNEILVFKDFTTVLEMHREERQAVLAQLREIYDGRYDQPFGTGKELHWKGRLGFLAGVTEAAIEQHQRAMAVLGERFVLLRPQQPDREEMAHAALEVQEHEPQLRDELHDAMRRFLLSRSTRVPTLSEDIEAALARAAEFVTRARSVVSRDGYYRDLECVPEPEGPPRFVKVLRSLACGIALAHDSQVVTQHDLQLVLRVAADSIPIMRRYILAAMCSASQSFTLEEVTAVLPRKASGTAVRRELEALEGLEIVTCAPRDGAAQLWSVRPELVAVAGQVLDVAPAGGNRGGPDTAKDREMLRRMRIFGPMLNALAELGTATFTEWQAASGMRKATFNRYLRELHSLPPDADSTKVVPPVIKAEDGRYAFVNETVRAAYRPRRPVPGKGAA